MYKFPISKSIVKIIVFLLLINLLGVGQVFSDELFSILLMTCDGFVMKTTPLENNYILGKKDIGDVQRCFLFNKTIYSIDNNRLLATNLYSNSSEYINDFNRQFDKNNHLWRVAYVDKNKFLIEAYTIDKTKTFPESHINVLMVFDRFKNKLYKLPLPEFLEGISSTNGDKIFFTRRNGIINIFENKSTYSLEVKGRYPTISPDGTKLAFIKSGFFLQSVSIYDLKKNHAYSVKNFLGIPGSIKSIIRWSNDNGFIAIKLKSDISKTSIYILNITLRKAVSKLKKYPACNWFFLKP